ncbi:Ti-type conjugative transfer relaxase TraA [Roseibium album]|uniref:Ti-type conjugative transfer relaxase TraA n=1 Tax=Roseibium album TaxID=311410 RepID=UPI003299065F
MILKASERGNAKNLADHLLNIQDNDHIEVHAINGFVAADVHGAFEEAEAISKATNCRKFLFSLSLSPPRDVVATVEDFEAAVTETLDRLGLTGQPHVMIFHEKLGRRHAHLVVSRIDTNTMKAINLSFYKEKLNALGREIYLTHGWDMPKGFTDRALSNPTNFRLEEWQVAKRTKRDPQSLKTALRQCWDQSDNRVSFEAALKEKGFWLARGDRRGFVALDHKGTVYSLSRWLGVKSKELKVRLGVPAELPSIESRLAEISTVLEDKLGDQALKLASDFTAKLDKLNEQKKRLVEQQRQDRAKLKSDQDSRRIAEATSRQQKLHKGLRGLWERITRQREKILSENAAILQDTIARDRLEQEAIIEKHRAGRQELQVQIDRLVKHQDKGRAELAVQIGAQAESGAADIAKRIRQSPDTVLDILTKEKSVFSEKDIETALKKFIPDLVERQEIKMKVVRSSELVCLTGDEERPHKKRYSSWEMVNLERQMIDDVSQMAGGKRFAIQSKHIDKAIAGQNALLQSESGAMLSEEQCEAIRHATGMEQISAVVGLAGAGKSTMLSAAREAWEAQGYNVLGAALAGKAAAGLQNSSGIKSRTLASFEMSWRNGKSELTGKDVLVIDEAGMIGSRQMARFVAHAKSKGAKIVLVGDPAQLQPIGAGAPFRAIVERIGFSELEQVRRQRVGWQREATKQLARGNIAEALHVYDERGAITFAANTDGAISELVEDYMADWEFSENSSSRIALAHRRADVHAINETIRERRKLNGELTDEKTIQTENGARGFAAGDRILFTQNDYQVGVRNGMLGTVDSISPETISVRLDEPTGNSKSDLVHVDLQDYSAIDHGYAVTIHKSQGCTVDRSFVLASASTDKNLTYVALSRHRENARVFAAKTEFKNVNFLSKELNREREIEMTLEFNNDSSANLEKSPRMNQNKEHNII